MKPSFKNLLIIILTLLALTFSALGFTPAQAATSRVVTKLADTNDGVCDSDCSLREAIAVAGAGDTITFGTLFDTAQTINLATELVIDKSLTIDGETHSVTVSGNHVTRVFNVKAGTVTFSLSHLTIAKGNVQTTDCGAYTSKCGGGMILQNNSAISVTVTDSAFSDNHADYQGGGINVGGGTLTVTNSTFVGNSAPSGGGIYHAAASTLTVTNSTFSGNSAADSGGGIFKRLFKN